MAASNILAVLAWLAVATHCQYMTVYDQHFQFTCPAGEILVHIESIHDNSHEDRVFNFYCRAPPGSVGLSECEWSGYVNDYDDPVQYSCPQEKVITGVESIHDNNHEDRRFSFQCCTADGTLAHGCYFSGDQNYYDGELNFAVDADHAIKGVISTHDNSHEDRLFNFEVCELDVVNPDVIVGR